MHFARAAYRSGMSLAARARQRPVGQREVPLRRLHRRGDARRSATRILEALAGQRVMDLQRLGPERARRDPAAVLPRGAAGGLEHQDAGRPAYIVTAAGQEMAETLAQVLALTAASACARRSADGVYTGRPDGPFTYREGKVDGDRGAGRRARASTWRECYAYSDSESDLPMLRAVGNPVAVNPDAELERIARERGLAGDALRQARPAAKIGAASRRAGAGRRRRRLRWRRGRARGVVCACAWQRRPWTS